MWRGAGLPSQFGYHLGRFDLIDVDEVEPFREREACRLACRLCEPFQSWSGEPNKRIVVARGRDLDDRAYLTVPLADGVTDGAVRRVSRAAARRCFG